MPARKKAPLVDVKFQARFLVSDGDGVLFGVEESATVFSCRTAFQGRLAHIAEDTLRDETRLHHDRWLVIDTHTGDVERYRIEPVCGVGVEVI